MAVKATLDCFEDKAVLHLRPDETLDRVGDEPPGLDSTAPLLFLWDSEKLERGEWDLLGVEVLSLPALGEQHLKDLDRLDLPRVDCGESGQVNATVAGVLRCAKQQHARRVRAKRSAA
jgi:hypothetical protein